MQGTKDGRFEMVDNCRYFGRPYVCKEERLYGDKTCRVSAACGYWKECSGALYGRLLPMKLNAAPVFHVVAAFAHAPQMCNESFGWRA